MQANDMVAPYYDMDASEMREYQAQQRRERALRYRLIAVDLDKGITYRFEGSKKAMTESYILWFKTVKESTVAGPLPNITFTVKDGQGRRIRQFNARQVRS